MYGFAAGSTRPTGMLSCPLEVVLVLSELFTFISSVLFRKEFASYSRVLVVTDLVVNRKGGKVVQIVAHSIHCADKFTPEYIGGILGTACCFRINSLP